MKRVPVFSVLVALVILAGFLLLFPVEWVGLLVLLLALIVSLVVLVRRHLHPIEAAPEARTARPTEPVTAEAAPPAAEPVTAAPVTSEAAPPAAEPAEETAPRQPAPAPFAPELFSRFQAHLESAERSAGEEAGEPPAETEPPPDPAAPTPEPPEAEAEPPEAAGDRVVLSAAARRQAKAPRARAMAPPADQAAKREAPSPSGGTAGEEDLFADLRPAPVEPDAGAPPAEERPAAGKGREKKAPRGAVSPAAQGGDEIEASLQKPQPSEAPRMEEGAMLLKMAEDALAQQDRAGAQAGLEQAVALYEALPGGVPWRARMVQARLAALDRDFPVVVEAYEQFLKHHPELEEADYLAPIEQLASPLAGEEAAALRVSLLLKVLAVLRQANDRRGMDRVYDLIEAAQEEAGDEQKLIQYYKNHLEIKKVLEDVDGQLGLIDRIGNRYYKLGDTQAAREFYEQGLKLRGDQEAAAEAAKAGEA
jgi:hypothetical protein